MCSSDLVPGGRETLQAFAQAWQVPVCVAFRRHDIFPNSHPLFVGDLGLANPADQLALLHSSELPTLVLSQAGVVMLLRPYCAGSIAWSWSTL